MRRDLRKWVTGQGRLATYDRGVKVQPPAKPDTKEHVTSPTVLDAKTPLAYNKTLG
jgi:hypothetical protein